MMAATDLRLLPAYTAPVRFSPILFVLFGVAAFAVNYPGWLNEDSIVQIVGVLDPRRLNDWHAPVIGFIWTAASPLFGNPGAATAVHCALLAFFVAVVPVRRGRTLALLSLTGLEVVLKLFLFAAAGIILKDILLAALLLCALACIQLGLGSGRRYWLPLALIPALLCMIVRPPNVLAGLIACALLLLLYAPSWRIGAAWLAAASAALIMLLPLQAVLNKGVFHARNSHSEMQIVLFDMAGVATMSAAPVFEQLPDWPAVALPAPSTCYEPVHWDSLSAWGVCRGYADAFNRAEWQHGRRTTFAWWARNIVAHPVAYLQHRLAFTKLLLAPAIIKGGELDRTEAIARTSADRRLIYGGPEPANPLRSWVDGFLASISSAEPWLVIMACSPAASSIICIWLFARVARRRSIARRWDAVVAAAAAVGIANLVMLMFLGVSSSPRYMLPTLVCALTGLVAAGRFRVWETRSEAGRAA